MKVYLIPILLMLGLTHISHFQMLESKPNVLADSRENLPSVDAIKLISLNYENLAADYYWLRAISHFGDKTMHQSGYPNLAPLLERTIHLDPHFQSSYFLAGTALTVGDAQALKKALQLLEFGLAYNPQDFRIPYLMGFIHYFYFSEFQLAAQYLAQAAQLPGCPKQIGPFATKLAAESEQPEIGLTLISTLLPTITDEELRKTYLNRQKLLTLEVELRHLSRAVKQYETRHNKLPTTLNDLVQPGLLSKLPGKDPLGGNYRIDAEGRIQTSSESQRLKLSNEFKERLR